jgi:beta-glucosidase-like glycosyl hydrolase
VTDITSDCDADANVYSTHHYTATPEEAVKDVLRAGTDVDCGGFVQKNAAAALAKGIITKDDIDTRLKFLFRMRLRLGHFDPPGPLQQIPKTAICTPETIALARDGTAQGSVLLKNLAKTLPLKSGGKVAVIGPNANLSSAIAVSLSNKLSGNPLVLPLSAPVCVRIMTCSVPAGLTLTNSVGRAASRRATTAGATLAQDSTAPPATSLRTPQTRSRSTPQ